MKQWILNSNRNFDKLDWWKLLIMMGFIIVTSCIDNYFFGEIPVIFASLSLIFVTWRMLGFHFARQEKGIKI